MVIILLVLLVFTAAPRQRENARMAGCRRNLMQIGIALALYDRSGGWLPTVSRLPPESDSNRAAPLLALLETLGLPDLTELSDVSVAPKSQPGLKISKRPIPGFLCQSDPRTASTTFPAPVSYRATTGDRPGGETGGFAPGVRRTLSEIEYGDGKAFTASFSERLIGTGRDGEADQVNYGKVADQLSEEGCPAAGAMRWFGNAGSSWAEIGWRSTLYNHVARPNAAPSCMTDDETAAYIGASSGHLGGVNVLLFDGSVRTVTPTIDPQVWKALATIKGGTATATLEPN